MLLAEKLAENPSLRGEAFNFSNEIQVTVLDLVSKILGLMNSKLQPQILNETKNEIRHQYLSAKKAREVLNWHPIFSLDQGLQRTLDWYRHYFSEGKHGNP
jgi:CDP-glucose 4,6-dehydratase